MKLSIIVPVYNMMAGGKLQNCLDSLIRQDVEDMEIIAVDDKSTDDSLQLLQQYSEKYGKRFVAIASPENKRQGGAKNIGLQHAKGEWIGFIDSDDWIAGDMFSKLLARAEETGADVVGCDYLLTDEIGKESGEVVYNNTEQQTGILGEAQYKALLLNPGSMVIKIYKRSLFAENNIIFPEKMFYEDNAIGVLPLLYAKRFERVPEALYFYYQNPTSTVHTVSIDRCRDRMQAARIYKAECEKRGFYERYAEEIDYKIFELGYKNTLFSYLQAADKPSRSFVGELHDFLAEMVPGYAGNPYYKQYVDGETDKLIGMHVKNTTLFLCYYRALRLYRKLRYKQ